jgi:hypothetical protein
MIEPGGWVTSQLGVGGGGSGGGGGTQRLSSTGLACVIGEQSTVLEQLMNELEGTRAESAGRHSPVGRTVAPWISEGGNGVGIWSDPIHWVRLYPSHLRSL